MLYEQRRSFKEIRNYNVIYLQSERDNLTQEYEGIQKFKEALQKLSKVLRDSKMSLQAKRMLNCYVISNFLYDSESWTIFS